jgi:hypothetical protein
MLAGFVVLRITNGILQGVECCLARGMHPTEGLDGS